MARDFSRELCGKTWSVNTALYLLLIARYLFDKFSIIVHSRFLFWAAMGVVVFSIFIFFLGVWFVGFDSNTKTNRLYRRWSLQNVRIMFFGFFFLDFLTENIFVDNICRCLWNWFYCVLNLYSYLGQSKLENYCWYSFIFWFWSSQLNMLWCHFSNTFIVIWV